MDVLISIKPCFVEKILDLSKRYEYRKRLFSQEIDRVYIYASAPIKKIVGYFPYNEVVSGDLNEMWKITADYSGISREYFDKYFDNKEIAYALSIRGLKIFEHGVNPNDIFERFVPPQSFFYIREGIAYEKLRNLKLAN